MGTRVSIFARNAELNALAALASKGSIRLYTGNQPLTADTPATGIALATLTFADPAFEPAQDGRIKAKPITADPSAKGGGTAGWFRIYAADGKALWDGTVGLKGANMNLNSLTINKDAHVSLTEFTHSLPMEE